MKSKLIDQMEDETNFTLTENGALTHKSSKSWVLDMFSTGGAYRTRTNSDILKLFKKAISEDLTLGLRCLFYLRDIRGGQGERKFFRVAMSHLVEEYPDVVVKNLSKIPEYGRWDDVVELLSYKNSNVRDAVVDLLVSQLTDDMKSETPSLLGKWMPSANTSSEVTRKKANYIITRMKITHREYRKMLTFLRNKISIVETPMCKNDWDAINYQRVPSKAFSNYRKAFVKHDESRFNTFLKKVEKGEAKINAGAIFPHDIINVVRHSNGSSLKASDLQWKNLPNYLPDDETSAIAVVDTSASMTWNAISGSKVYPIDVAIGFGIYFAERCKGPFKNAFISFQTTPQLVRVKGNNLKEKYDNAIATPWGSTNIQGVFDLILSSAKKASCKQSDIPKHVFIFSDMEFNDATHEYGRGSRTTNYAEIERKFNAAGYKCPTLVFWNVCSRNDQSPVTMADDGSLMVSGFSPSTISNILNGKSYNPYDLMVEVLNGKRYNKLVA